MHVRVPASTFTSLEQTLERLERKVDGDHAEEAKKALPRWLPNGDEITSIKQLAAVLNVDETAAAYITLVAHEPPKSLVRQAKNVFGGMRGPSTATPSGAVAAPFTTLPGPLQRPHSAQIARIVGSRSTSTGKRVRRAKATTNS